MQSKAEIVRSWLSASFGGVTVSHRYVDMLHKFRVETTPLRWLYVSDEFLDDQSEADLLVALRDFEVFERLIAKPGSTHLLLTHTSLVEVDGEFGRSASA